MKQTVITGSTLVGGRVDLAGDLQLHTTQRPRRAPWEVEAERVDRLAADAELVNRLQWAGYSGPEWEIFRQALARYGLAVLGPWIQTGRIFQECRAKGAPTLPPIPRTTDDAQELALETVALALPYFREQVLMAKRWDPEKGACLKTFFIGACMFHFRTAYNRWLRDNAASAA